MSGNHFDTSTYSLKSLAEELELVLNNKRQFPEFSEETWSKMEIALRQLEKTYNMLHAIDYLMEGDYGDESFLEAWKEEVGE